MIGFFIAGAVMLWMAAYLVWTAVARRLMARAARNWPTTPGTITESQLSFEHIPSKEGRSYHYRPTIGYKYTVGTRHYHGSRVAIFDEGYYQSDREGDTAKGERYLAEFPPDKVVTVHYNPADPWRATLRVDQPRSSVLIDLVLGLVPAGIGVGCFLAGLAMQ